MQGPLAGKAGLATGTVLPAQTPLTLIGWGRWDHDGNNQSAPSYLQQVSKGGPQCWARLEWEGTAQAQHSVLRCAWARPASPDLPVSSSRGRRIVWSRATEQRGPASRCADHPVPADPGLLPVGVHTDRAAGPRQHHDLHP